MNPKKIFKSIRNYSGIYLTGVIISGSFVLYCNEMFYMSVFKRISPVSGTKTNLLQEIRPRELFGNNAKHTFLSSKIEEDQNDEARIYHSYIQNRKNPDSSSNTVFSNIYDKKI